MCSMTKDKMVFFSSDLCNLAKFGRHARPYMNSTCSYIVSAFEKKSNFIRISKTAIFM